MIIKARFQVVEKPRPSFPSDEAYLNTRSWRHYRRGEVLVIVDKAVYGDVSVSIDQYILDIGRECYWGTIHVVTGGGPANIRDYIKNHRCVGALLVGAVPAPWFELVNDFHGATTSFPCDLYYMDTNANWIDPDGNGKFNSVTGNVNPEIWVGRLYTPTMNGVLERTLMALSVDGRRGLTSGIRFER